MACPTCDHTMHSFGVSFPPVYWCPRCGTLKHINAQHKFTVECPNLVERLNDWTKLGDMSAAQIGQWQRLGIEDAITHPSDHD